MICAMISVRSCPARSPVVDRSGGLWASLDREGEYICEEKCDVYICEDKCDIDKWNSFDKKRILGCTLKRPETVL